MNIAQNLFAVFYGVLYAAMLSSLTGFRAFPWGFLAEPTGKLNLLWRLAVAIVCFNVVPFLVFALGFQLLSAQCGVPTYWQVFAIAIASLSVFAPYRLYTLIVVFLRRSQRLSLYCGEEYKNIIEKRSIRDSVFGNVLAITFYGSLFFLVFLART
jgi:hypothetical protein